MEQEPTYHLEGVIRTKEDMVDFEGPLTLILMLLSRNKIEIRDIRISEILEQYLAYLDEMKSMDLEIASEFIQMASYLLYIKTKMLLTSDEEEVSELELLLASLEQMKARNAYHTIQSVTPALLKASQEGVRYHAKQPEPLPGRKTYQYRHESWELLKAVAEHRELSPEEKAECLSDIFKYRTADAMLKAQTAEENSKNFMTVKKRITERQQATKRLKTDNVPLPEGMKPLGEIGTDIQEFHHRMQLFKTPSVTKELAEDQENLDKLTEMTLEGLKLDGRKLEELDTETLAKKLTGGKGPAGKTLMEEQGKLLQAEERAKLQEEAARQREKQQEEAIERELNDAVIYEPGGMQP